MFEWFKRFLDVGQKGTHKHKCPECGCVWRHPDRSRHEAHYCPDCGRYENLKYYGPEEPGDKERGIRAVHYER